MANQSAPVELSACRKVIAFNAMDLFRAACERDLEGIVAKLTRGTYTPDETTWVKIKNRRYSQAEGRADFFDGRAFRAVV